MRPASHRPLVVVLALFLGVTCAVPAETGKIRLLDHIGPDPLMVSAAGETNFAEVFDGWIGMVETFSGEDLGDKVDQGLLEFEAEIGCSVMDDLLKRIGPEYAFVIDLPPIDSLMGAAAAGPAGIGNALNNLGLLALVDGTQVFESCLRRLWENGDARLVDEDGLVRIELDTSEAGGGFALYYGIEGDVFALGTSPEFVRGSLKPRPKGQRLADSRDFAKVFEHLDAAPTSLTYVNLPRARERVQGSMFVQQMIAAEPEAALVIQALMRPDFSRIGIGSTSVRFEEGTRTTFFGPSALSGGLGGASSGVLAAIAVPNLLNAIDRGKQKRTMADMRSAGTAIEAYAIDSNAYPGPTDGYDLLETWSDTLSPEYIRELPTEDGWGNPLLVWSDKRSYRIISLGKGNSEDYTLADPDGAGPTGQFTADIVFEDGSFITWPEGAQQ